jgi:proline iminopeptidase
MAESFVISNDVSLWTTRKGKGSPVMLYNGGVGCCDYLAPAEKQQ